MNSDTPRADTLEAMGCLTPTFLRQLETELVGVQMELGATKGELAAAKASKAKRALDYIDRICEVCGHTQNEDRDGCANCLKLELEAADQDAERLAGILSLVLKEDWNGEEEPDHHRGPEIRDALFTHETRINKPCLQQTAKP